MAKKKLSLKPVARGFATTSQQAKKPPPGPAEPEQKPDPVPSAPVIEQAENSSAGPSQTAKDSWEDEVNLEDSALQGYVERLQERGDREVTRILKAMEFDKRLGKSFLPLALNEQIRDQVLNLALNTGTDSIASLAPSADEDKVLLRFYTIDRVLVSLGFNVDRVAECLRALDGEASWEDALEWMWLHCSEDEILQRGEWKPVQSERDQPASLQSMIPVPTPVVAVPVESITDASEQTMEGVKPAPEVSSFFASGDATDSEPEEDVNPSKAWADLMLELDNAKLAAQKFGLAGKKKAKGGVETPETRRLKEKISAIENVYIFNKKEAEIEYKALKSKAQADSLASRLRGTSITSSSAATSNAPSTAMSTAPTSPIQVAAPEPVHVLDGDGEGDLFGGMLDEPVVVTSSDAIESANTTMQVRPMPIPKSFTNVGSVPKAMLKTTVSKLAKYAVVTYACLSGQSRAARAGVEIRWSLDRRQVWAMTDLACDSMVEAENYVSTLALHALAVEGTAQINWRVLPPLFRELWEELDMEAKNSKATASRDIWRRIQDVVKPKTAKEESNGAAPQSSKAASTGGADTTVETTRIMEPSDSLRESFEARQATRAYQDMLKQRSTLPIASFREQIVSSLESSQILVLSGETGCGKSTQLPSFILEDQLSKGNPCKIYVTEPRRISAISLAQRVSRELGDGPNAVGTPSSLVGYSIRLESLISKNTRLAFVTNGIALRMLESGSGVAGKSTAFDEITHIIVDEVHERSIESDFLLIVLKTLMKQRQDLKVVLMSATVDADKISDFFGGCPTLSVPGRTFPVDVNFLEDAVEYTGWRIKDNSPYAIRRHKRGNLKQMEWNEEAGDGEDDEDDDSQVSDPLKLSSTRYSPDAVDTINLLDPKHIPYELILRLLERLCFEDESSKPYSQAILIFLPGLAEIRRTNDMLQEHPRFGGQEFKVYPLHSSVSSEGQSAVFDVPPPGVRKIVISTNIAETGVTIPDITCVIDSGKHREMRYDEKRQLSRLVETYIARSNAKQRRGRAGRVQDGLAFHLFTRARHDMQMVEHPSPEMLRLSLQDLALRIKILKIKIGTSIEDVLLRALDPPAVINIQRAVASLVEVKALTTAEEITPMGRLLSKLPMDVHLGKFLLMAALFRCLDPALTIAATLNGKSPFVAPFGMEHQADLAKSSFKTGNSDFLTLHNVFASWRRASENPNFIRTYCKRNFLSHQNLQQVEELRQQLLSYLVDSAFVPRSDGLRKELNQARNSRGFRTRFVTIPPELDTNAEHVPILSSALAAGLYPKLLVIDSATGGMKTITNGQGASIHPSSVNFRTPKNEYGTNHLVYFTLMQSKKLYAWEVGPVDDKALVLLCGDIADFRLSASSLQIDRRLKFTIEPKSALALKHLRQGFNAAISTLMRSKSLGAAQQQWFDLGIKCLEMGLFEDETQSVGLVTRK